MTHNYYFNVQRTTPLGTTPLGLRAAWGVGLAALAVLMTGGAHAQGVGWTIPPDAGDLRSPLSVTPGVLKTGKGVFASRCQACHGPEGRGNGPRSDPDHPAADLTDRARVALNPEGVMFYKVWNGRQPMPAFKSSLSKDEVWAVVEYVKSLRRD